MRRFTPHLVTAFPASTSLSARARRVVALILTIVLLSSADLYITLVYLHSGGMSEGNPVARWIMGHDSPALLMLWKGLTVGIAVAIFYATRRTPAAEFGAWTCVLLLTWLTIHWASYSDAIRGFTPELDVLVQNHKHTRWVTMSTSR